MKIIQLLPTVLALAAGIFIGHRFLGNTTDTTGLPSLDGAGPAPSSVFDAPAAARGAGTAPGRSAADAEGTAAVLAARLDAERTEREALAQRIEEMAEQLESLEQRLEGTAAVISDPQALATAAIEQTIAELETSAEAVDPDERQLQRYIEAGFSPARAEALKARQDEISLERIFLRDRARREGWMGTQRYREELQRIDGRVDQLRQELGDEDYDRFLYATGRPNRVVVRNTLTGGPAEEAGLRPGDAIVSYDGQRVFDTRALVSKTQEGNFGAPTPVEVERDGERIVLYVPRGPLGVNMRSSTRRPGEG